MLTRKHISALVHMPHLNPKIEGFSYAPFEIDIPDYDLKSPFAEKLQLKFGHQMEIAFSQAIERVNNWKIIAQNLQCISNGATKGELDFIVKQVEDNTFYHIELAVKFYLYVPFSDNEIECFIGPNKHDLLHEKLNKLSQKQFPILYEKEIAALLKPFRIDPDEVIQRVYFKAFVFNPFDDKNYQFQNINNECVAGNYLNLYKLEQLVDSDTKVYLPEKLDWIVEPNYHKTWHDWEIVKPELERQLENKNAPMVWIKNHESVARFFVVWWL